MSRLLDRRVPANRRAELAVAMLLLAAGALAAAFAVVQLADPDTQLLGLTLGLAAAAAAGALGVAGRLMVAQETRVEPRPLPEPAGPGEDVADLAAAGGEGISRGRLLAVAGGVAGASVVAAALAPLGSLGPSDEGIGSSPWKDGTRLVDESGDPIAAAAVELGTFTTAFPEGADPRELGSPVVLLRLSPGDIHDRPGWSPTGSSRTRRSAPTQAARWRCSATAASARTCPARRWSARATTPRSTRRTPGACCSDRPGARCPSCRCG